jgi:hypothetical protein
MTVGELIAELQKVDKDSRIFMGYDGDVVVTEPSGVEAILSEEQIGSCWYSVKVGDVVILCAS